MKYEKKKRKEAVALSYNDRLHNSPNLVAKGKGIIADNIIAAARENDVLIQEDSSLVELLGKLEINENIPEDLYQAVAEVFAFIYRADKEAGRLK